MDGTSWPAQLRLCLRLFWIRKVPGRFSEELEAPCQQLSVSLEYIVAVI